MIKLIRFFYVCYIFYVFMDTSADFLVNNYKLKMSKTHVFKKLFDKFFVPATFVGSNVKT